MSDEVNREALLRMWPKWPVSETAANSDINSRGHKRSPHGCYAPSNHCTGWIGRAR